ncbi:MAG: citrate/2-methylcitrate synthase [Desulfobulbaceae bacterium]
MSNDKGSLRKRDLQFDDRSATRIWCEQPAPDNPYLAARCLCHGYDIVELARKRSFVDVLFLLFIGELPTQEQADLLETLMIAFINPGPRHPATRAAMNGGVGKTQAMHLLPIGLSVLGGSHLGGEEVLLSMKYLRKNRDRDARALARKILRQPGSEEGNCHLIPGFGSRFGSIDPIPQQLPDLLAEMPASGDALRWGGQVVEEIKPHGMGWLTTGITAAVLCDLGFSPLSGAGLFQIISAPGLLAHGLEFIDKPITSMPFLDENHYVISKQGKTR